MNAVRGQGTIEYLIIIAIVVVMALVVVGLLISQTGSTESVSSNANKLSSMTSLVGIKDSAADTDGNLLLVVQSNMGENITVTKMTVDGVDYAGYSESFSGGDSRTFDLNGLTACSGGSRDYSISIGYTSGSGLDKVIDLGKVKVTCVPRVVPVGAVVGKPSVNNNMVVQHTITFDVLDSDSGSHLDGVGAACNVSAYNKTGQGYGFSIDFNSGAYSCSFSKSGYDDNSNFSVDATSDGAYTVYLTQSITPVVTHRINFNVLDSSSGLDLSGVTVTCDNSWYDRSGQSSPFYIDFNENTYDCTFSKTSYDSNTGFTVAADSDKTYTVELSPQGGGGEHALQFDGSQNYVSVPTSTDFTNQSALTVETWVKCSAPFSSEAELVAMWNNNDGGREWIFGAYSNTRLFFGRGNGEFNQVDVNNFCDNGWHHIAAVWDGNTNVLYLDGTEVSSVEGTNPFLSLTPELTIGHQDEGATTFPGTIDEVRISKIARYTSSFTPSHKFTTDSNTIALWHFDEGSGGTVSDASGNGHNGTLQGSPLPQWVAGLAITGAELSTSDSQFGTDHGLVGLWHLDGSNVDATGSHDGVWSGNEQYASGLWGHQAANFDGSSVMSINHSNQYASLAFTISFWASFPSDNPSSGGLMGNHPGGGCFNGMFLMRFSGNPNELTTYVNPDGGGCGGMTSLFPSPIVAGTWHNIIFVWGNDGNTTGNKMKMYIDGQLIDSTVIEDHSPSGTALDTSELFKLGGMNDGERMTGKMQEAAIWNRALSSDEVSTLYNTKYGQGS